MKLRPFYAVLEREVLRMIRQRTRLVAAMVRPLIWLLVIGGGFNSVTNFAPISAFSLETIWRSI